LESQLKAGRLTQREEHQERGRFLNIESMARVQMKRQVETKVGVT
jgi:hypothetical protein